MSENYEISPVLPSTFALTCENFMCLQARDANGCSVLRFSEGFDLKIIGFGTQK